MFQHSLVLIHPMWEIGNDFFPWLSVDVGGSDKLEDPVWKRKIYLYCPQSGKKPHMYYNDV